MTTAKQKYSIIEKECFVIVAGVSKFSAYILGNNCLVRNDHDLIVGLLNVIYDAKPWTLGGDCLWDFDRACIYVSACIDAPGRG